MWKKLYVSCCLALIRRANAIHINMELKWDMKTCKNVTYNAAYFSLQSQTQAFFQVQWRFFLRKIFGWWTAARPEEVFL